MPNLPQVSGKEMIRALEKHGYQVARTKGSHVRLYPPANRKDLAKVTVPLHKTLKPGTLHNIVRSSGISIEELK